MRILLATGVEELDQNLALEIQRQKLVVAGICLYREAVVQDVQGKGADTVILSVNLPGSCDIITGIILPLRAQDVRIILLPGKRDEEKTKNLIARAVVYGVYDLIYDPVTVLKVLERLQNPASFSDVNKDLKGVNLEDQAEVLNQLKELQVEKIKEEEVPRKKEHRERLKPKIKLKMPRPRLNLPEIKLPHLTLPSMPHVEVPTLPKANGSKNQLRDMLCTVWNPSGFFLSSTALNLAVTAASQEYDVALINFNFVNPETDIWFGIKQGKEVNPYDAGIMTFGEKLKPELAVKMLQDRAWGVKYLPCGNKLESLGTPDFGNEGVQLAKSIITSVAGRKASKSRLTIIEASSSYEHPFTYAALNLCHALIIPTSGGIQELIIIKQQMGELKRLEAIPEDIGFLFVCQGDAPKTPRRRIIIPPDWEGYQQASLAGKPYCLLDHAKQEIWSEVVDSALRV